MILIVIFLKDGEEILKLGTVSENFVSLSDVSGELECADVETEMCIRDRTISVLFSQQFPFQTGSKEVNIFTLQPGFCIFLSGFTGCDPSNFQTW